MSGGEYNYLHDFLRDLGGRRADAKKVRLRLEKLGYSDIATDFEHAIERFGDLVDVVQAVEWLDSGDWGREQLDQAAEKYRRRTETPATPPTS